jgi:HEPN domain-containing protein
VQQCIEKLFKAELMRLMLPVPKTHNLRELSDLLHQADNHWIAETMTLSRLSQAAVDFLYPDPSEPELEIDLEFILQIASELRKLLLDRLGSCR